MARSKIRSEVWEGEDIPTRARVITDDGSALSPSTTSAVLVKVFDLSLGVSDPATAVWETSTATTSTVVYSSYRTSGWTQDSTGYNVEYLLRQTSIPTSSALKGGHTYRIVLDLITNSYGHIHVVHDVNVRSHLGD